ncbi:MAG: NAD-dependent epimerase/dehydratase family protein [Candidatus Micrarchaeota archaeon]
MRVVIIGGTGFIGSHLSDALLAKWKSDVLVLDNLSTSDRKNINSNIEFVKSDIVNDEITGLLNSAEVVFHFAADPNVKESATTQKTNFELNVRGTFNVLEACRKADVKNVIFASTSAVYGTAKVIPTPEIHPAFPISNYGASKLAGEAYCSSFAHTYNMRCTVLRLANIFGERSRCGVMFDFYKKLKKNQKKLEILGNGKQNKSYLYISDCISAILTVFEKQSKIFDIFNVGSEERHTVDEIAELIAKSMNLAPKFEYTGESGGWIGDITDMLLDIRKIKSFGWRPKISFAEGIKRYVNWLKIKM